MNEVGLEIAREKTKVVSLNKKFIPENFELDLLDYKTKLDLNLKHLDVIFVSNKNCKLHIEKVTQKGITVMAGLARLMANVGGPKELTCRTYYRVMESVVLYACPIWHTAIHLAINRKKIFGVQKVGLGRIIRAYITVSLDALTERSKRNLKYKTRSIER